MFAIYRKKKKLKGKHTAGRSRQDKVSGQVDYSPSLDPSKSSNQSNYDSSSDVSTSRESCTSKGHNSLRSRSRSCSPSGSGPPASPDFAGFESSSPPNEIEKCARTADGKENSTQGGTAFSSPTVDSRPNTLDQPLPLSGIAVGAVVSPPPAPPTRDSSTSDEFRMTSDEFKLVSGKKRKAAESLSIEVSSNRLNNNNNSGSVSAASSGNLPLPSKKIKPAGNKYRRGALHCLCSCCRR